MSESYPPVLLAKKTTHLIKSTGNPNLVSCLVSPLPPTILLKRPILLPRKLLFLSPLVFLLSLYTAIVYYYLYLCFTTFPTLLEAQYGFSQGTAGLVYLGIGVGSFLGIAVGGLLSDRIVVKLVRRKGGEPRPEYRLPTMMVGGFVVPAGFFMYGVSTTLRQFLFPVTIRDSFCGQGVARWRTRGRGSR